MPIKAPSQTYSFSSGAVPGLEFRSDVERYYSGALDIQNMIAGATGFLRARGGSRFIREHSGADDNTLYVEFEYSETAKYLLVIMNLKVEVYDGTTKALKATVTTPWTSAQLSNIRYTQALDTIIVMHPDHEPRRIVRNSGDDTVWTLSPLPMKNLPTFQYTDDTVGTCTPSGSVDFGETATLTSTSGDFANVPASPSGQGWVVYINGGRVKITGKTSSTVVTGTVSDKLTDQKAAEPGDWQVEEPVFSSSRGWPHSLDLYEGRQTIGGAKANPNGSWAAKAGTFFDFETSTDALDDEAGETFVGGQKLGTIRDTLAADVLFLFSTNGIWAVQETPITTTNYVAQLQTSIPAANVRPILIEDAPGFIMARKNGDPLSLFEITYDGNREKYGAEDLALLAQSYMRGPVDMDERKGQTEDTANHVFLVNGDDGTVPVIQTRRSQKIAGWSMFNFPVGEVLRVAVVGNAVFFLIKRTINGATRYYMEELTDDLSHDCALTDTDGTAKSLWSGFSHLEGQTVRVKGDGAYKGEFVVSGGNIDLSALGDEGNISSIEAGLVYEWRLETMPVAAELQNGTVIGHRHRIVWAAIQMVNTFDFYAQVGSEVRPVRSRPFGAATFGPLKSFTGSKKVRFKTWFKDEGGTVTLYGDKPAEIHSLTKWIAQ